jgi:TolB-like protein/Tfp pilus assembly protein PilF
MSFFAELKRRNVVRVGIAYVVVGWLVLQLTEVLSELLNLPESIGPIVVAIVAIGLPLALFFAWAFEMTPEGIKKEKNVDRSQSITGHTGRRLDRMIIVVLVVALGYFVFDKFFLQPAELEDQAVAQQTQQTAEETGPRTLAVLPLVNMSADADNEYFSDGLTEELLNILAKINELRVAGRTSSFAFKGKNEDLREIATKLNVETILEGSVRKDDARNKVRITLQLINAEDGYHLWSETYDRDLDDIFAIQEEVARQVAAALRVTLLGEDEARLAARNHTDLTAYELYLQGLKQLNEFSHTSLPEALDSFRQASAQDSEYLPAAVKQAATLVLMRRTGLITTQEAMDQAQPLLEAVLAADPQIDEAHVWQGNIYGMQRREERARESYRSALDINPRNVFALAALGRSYFNWGEAERGTEYLLEAERVDPYNTSVLYELCYTSALKADVESAVHYGDRIIELEPDNPNPYWAMALGHWLAGDVVSAIRTQLTAHEVDPGDFELSAIMTAMWLDLGDIEMADHWSKIADETGADQPVPTRSRVRLMQFREQDALAADLARRAIDSGMDNRQGSAASFRRALIRHLYDQGQYDEALAYLEEGIAPAFSLPPEYRLNVPFDAEQHLEAALLLNALDPKSERADGLVDAAEQKFGIYDPSVMPSRRLVERAAIAEARGNRDLALELLNDSLTLGLPINWREHLLVSLFFDGMRDDPRFIALLERIEDEMDRQRVLAHELVGVES